jgi:phospho-N-acetylmuramoyl-pentapeptide-transferase
LPFVNKTIEVGIFAMPIIAILFLAVTNSVNLTDGLDGLASSVSAVYLFSFAILLTLQAKYFDNTYPLTQELQPILRLCYASVGSLLGFLIFNSNKASVFMGDTGSLALGGLIGSVTIFSGNTLFLPLLGFIFVLSSISVIIQVFVYKKTKTRVFLMAPFHHHLQHKGLSECKISYVYSLITLIIAVFLMLFYL